ncbi:hypothetical protein QBC47DRAFT_359514 [Echria macrotheca]|uniref:Uncharacterized protein n=1 Tax=Echria macrotheca TaxID=438768 RepID=A0AAJ0BFH6_9PEZI|nr:hypothetical protein QBC47DRAFT_359514 [Echria macrotheca]
MSANNQSGTGQLSDHKVAEVGRKVHYAVLNFVIWTFKDYKSEVVSSLYLAYERKPRFLKYLKATTMIPTDYTAVLLDEDEGGAMILEAFLWQVLTYEVLGKYLWVGEADSKLLTKMKATLAPDASMPGQSPRQAHAQWHDWVCQTAKLLRDANQWRNLGDEWKDKLVTDILDVMAHGLSYLDRGRLTTELREIIETALKQDEILSLQKADVRWKYPFSKVFVDDRMSDREQFIGASVDTFGAVRITITPALVKVHKFMEGNMLDATALLKSIVHCHRLYTGC